MRFITVIIILFISFPLYAGPYINIKSIDACSDYPKIMISTQIKGASKSDITLIDWKNISVYEDGSVVKNKIEVVKENPDENFLYLVLSIDSSKSISSKDLTKIKISAVDIVRSIGPKDKIAIYHFNDDVMQLHDFSRDINNIEKSINAIKRHGKKTLLYNSIHESLMLFEKVNQTNKKIIVFTDGKDEGSSINDDDIIQLARSADIPIYFICFKDSNNIRIMARISKLTGGKLIYSKDHEDISGMYDTILSVMKNSYNVYYTTDLKRDGQIHELEISIKLGELKDSDTKKIQMPAKSLIDYFSFSSNAIYIAIIFCLLIILMLIILLFMVREKRILRERNAEANIINPDRISRHGIAYDDDNGFNSVIDTNTELHHLNAWMIQKNGPEMGKKYKITSREISIGQSADNSIILDDDMVSPKHAKIVCREGMFHLLDLISENGTFLNGKKLLRPKELHDWDELKFGNTILIFRGSPIPV